MTPKTKLLVGYDHLLCPFFMQIPFNAFTNKFTLGVNIFKNIQK